MQNSDSPDSSLQAILYVNETGAKQVPVRTRQRLPTLAVMLICGATAACAVGAVTYKVKQTPSLATVPGVHLRVMHPAAQQRAVAAPATQAVHRRSTVRLMVAVVHHDRATIHHHISATQAVPTKVVALVVLPTAKPAASMHGTASMPDAVATHHHYHLHRRFAALTVTPEHATNRVSYTAVAALPAPAVPDPVITRFDAAPDSIPQGSGASLCVAASHATQLSISGLGEVNPLVLDCRHVSPAVTTTYTVWAVNNLGVTVSQNVTVTVTHTNL